MRSFASFLSESVSRTAPAASELSPHGKPLGGSTGARLHTHMVDGSQWVVKPVHREDVDLDDPHIAKKVNDLKHRIESLMSSGADIEALDRLKDKIKNMRLSGLKHSGELSIENLVFKELRNEGILDRMTEYMNQKQDQELSL